MSERRTHVVGSRGSRLALAQTNAVIDMLKRGHPDADFRIEVLKTTGDAFLAPSLAEMGSVGVFVKELEAALLDGRTDFAVHSLKDVPTDLPSELTIAATPPREDQRDAFVSAKHARLADVPEGAKIATSSPRRAAQILSLAPNARVVDIRGNVETRVKKARRELDGAVLAAAGLIRLGMQEVITEFLEPTVFVPAIGQGAIGIECRTNDASVVAMLAAINDAPTFAATAAERALLRALGGGCAVPVAAYAKVTGSELYLKGLVIATDGKRRCEAETSGQAEDAETLGASLAQRLVEMGADEILNA